MFSSSMRSIDFNRCQNRQCYCFSCKENIIKSSVSFRNRIMWKFTAFIFIFRKIYTFFFIYFEINTSFQKTNLVAEYKENQITLKMCHYFIITTDFSQKKISTKQFLITPMNVPLWHYQSRNITKGDFWITFQI